MHTIVSGKIPEPITAARSHEGVIPHSYIAVENTQHCSCCGSTTAWTQLFARTFLRSTLGAGTPIRNLRHLDWPKYNLPIEQVRGIHEELPFCSSCYKPSLAHNYEMIEPPAPDMSKVIVGFRGTTMQGTTSSPPESKAAKPKATLDSLADLLL